MEVHLHFGMHRDVGVIHSEIGTLDGIVVPAHILAHQKPSTSAFVTSLPQGMPYIIDPATYRFQNSRDRHLNDAEELRSSTRKLCDEYHQELGQLVLDHGELRPELLPPPEELTEGVLAFQTNTVEEGSKKSAARKYLEKYDRSSLRQPRAIIPPYFRFDLPGDPWYLYSLECAQAAARALPGAAVTPIIHAPSTAFREAPLVQILRDYADFGHLILWVDDYNEVFVRAEQVRTIRSAITRFRESAGRVEAHYGGYLLLLSSHDGLASIAHGILYAQHKSYQISGPGQGGAAERYYIPGLRQFRSLSQADLILHRFPELICGCSICSETLGDNPDRIVNFFDDPELLRRHFLNARRREADAIPTRSLADEAADLRAIHGKYHEILRALPNPDALVSHSSMQGLGFLLEWAEGIEAGA